jgi:hypothetical protein
MVMKRTRQRSKASAELPHEMWDAAWHGKLQVVARAVKAGLDINAGGGTLLRAAAGAGRRRLVAWLLENGASVNASSMMGTPLHEAARLKDPEMVCCLLRAGADVGAKDDVGYRALQMVTGGSHAAPRTRQRATVKALLAAGANPKDLDKAGRAGLRKRRRGPPDLARPTQRGLSAELGVRAPDAYVALQRFAFDGSDTRIQRAQYYESLLGFHFASTYADYCADPPEMLVFGATGVDGIQLGFVVHTPELRLPDYRVVMIAPIGRDPEVLGESTVEAVSHLVRVTMQSVGELSIEQEERLSELRREFGAAFPGRRRPKNSFWPKPSVPAGYRFVRTTDGMGVVASRDAFSRRIPTKPSESGWGECDLALPLAKQALRAGAPASALVLCKDALADDFDAAEIPEVRACCVQAYEELGRPLHARRAAKMKLPSRHEL